MDVSETKDGLTAELEVPGMDPKNIQISLQEHLLTITLPKTPTSRGTTIPIKAEWQPSANEATRGREDPTPRHSPHQVATGPARVRPTTS